MNLCAVLEFSVASLSPHYTSSVLPSKQVVRTQIASEFRSSP
ncbi:hypothetical protein AZE42_13859 [Rhizopogon vesiculosus]|uniref:Uncharacterized protein n=1 Tax=Rhizopogon vesiculosus TaxID=180088 RepID=A0A1J8QUZ5_9AGAM|nr:hypothetical protein AZE42_13859 [Rhizopogon vesiculosus]